MKPGNRSRMAPIKFSHESDHTLISDRKRKSRLQMKIKVDREKDKQRKQEMRAEGAEEERKGYSSKGEQVQGQQAAAGQQEEGCQEASGEKVIHEWKKINIIVSSIIIHILLRYHTFLQLRILVQLAFWGHFRVISGSFGNFQAISGGY